MTAPYDPVIAELMSVGRRVQVSGPDVGNDIGTIRAVLVDGDGRPVLFVLDSDTRGQHTGYRWGAITSIRPAGPPHPGLA